MAINKKRFVTTITVYTYGEHVGEAFDESQKMCDQLNKKHDCRADVEAMSESNHGQMSPTPIDIRILKSKS